MHEIRKKDLHTRVQLSLSPTISASNFPQTRSSSTEFLSKLCLVMELVLRPLKFGHSTLGNQALFDGSAMKLVSEQSALLPYLLLTK